MDEIEAYDSSHCDICGKKNYKWDECREESNDFLMKNMEDFAIFKSHWGYFSNKDLTEHECVMCSTCYDKVAKFINSIGGKIRQYVYAPWVDQSHFIQPEKVIKITKEIRVPPQYKDYIPKDPDNDLSPTPQV